MAYKFECICKQCGTVAAPIVKKPGSWIITLILLCCYLVPGIIYMIWRATKKHNVCGCCGSPDVVGTTTPIGKKLVAELVELPAVGHVMTR